MKTTRRGFIKSCAVGLGAAFLGKSVLPADDSLLLRNGERIYPDPTVSYSGFGMAQDKREGATVHYERYSINPDDWRTTYASLKNV